MKRNPASARFCWILAVVSLCHGGVACADQAARQLALSYQDHILRIEATQQKLAPDQADARLQAFRAQLPQDPSPGDVHELRLVLDQAFETWLDAIEMQVTSSVTWPAGRPAEDWRPLAQLRLTQLREGMTEALISDGDPLPLLQNAAGIAAWTRGENQSTDLFAGHDARVEAMLVGNEPPGIVVPPQRKLPGEAEELPRDGVTQWTCAAPDPTYEYATNRYGGDFQHLDLPVPCPELCAKVCEIEKRCRAWTFVKPGNEGAGCWLKDSEPAPTANSCCVSGTVARPPSDQP